MTPMGAPPAFLYITARLGAVWGGGLGGPKKTRSVPVSVAQEF